MEVKQILVFFLPLVVYLLIAMFGRVSKNSIKKSPFVFAIFYVCYLTLLMSISDSDYGDKYLYAQMYMYADTRFADGYKDGGWLAYVLLLRNILGASNVFGFFLVTAFIYCSSYLIYAYRVLGKEFATQFVVFASGLLGFYSYGVNTIRNGVSFSMILLALSVEKKWLRFVLFMFSIMLHKSSFIFILVYYAQALFPKITSIKYSVIFWILCFVISAFGFSLLEYAEFFGFIDSRIDSYAFSNTDRFKSGFRIDFIIYSLIPISYCLFLVYKFKIKDVVYRSLLSIYILINSLWLLVIRMPFTNRIAYLSWFMIPIIVLFPYVKGLVPPKKANALSFQITLLLLLINIILILRDY